MRTTLTLDEDVVEKARIISKKLHKPFRQIINEALRTGLENAEKPAVQKTYKTESHAMYLHEGLDIDNIDELLTRIEGDRHK